VNPTAHDLSVAGSLDCLHKVRQFLLEKLKQASLAGEDRHRVILAVDEAVANVIEHGYRGRVVGDIKVRLAFSPHQLTVKIWDWGCSFDLRRYPEVDIDGHVALGKRKGLGIQIIRKVMDEIYYSASPKGMNELILIKYIAQKTADDGRGG